MAMIWLMMNDGDKAADHVAEPSEHANHENNRPERVADEWLHVILQRQQARGETGKRAANGRRHQINPALIDAHESDDLAILRDGADRGADIGAFEKQIEQRPRRPARRRTQSAAQSYIKIVAISMIGRRTPILRNSVPNSSVAKL